MALSRRLLHQKSRPSAPQLQSPSKKVALLVPPAPAVLERLHHGSRKSLPAPPAPAQLQPDRLFQSRLVRGIAPNALIVMLAQRKSVSCVELVVRP